jgi:hypothetical protein
MLIPLEEAELLDILYRKYLNENNNASSALFPLIILKNVTLTFSSFRQENWF